MSAMVCGKSTINAVVNLADALHPRGFVLANVSVPSVDHEPERRDALNDVGNALWRLNNDAVNARYPNEPEPAPEGFAYAPTPVQGPGDIKRLLREAYTLDDQLQHGDVPERSEYRQFERLMIRAGYELARD
jgi:hypothetical protein